MKILGIETSCDETSIAIVEDGKKILSNIISSQIEIHKEYGGVVPEIASRHHVKNISNILEEALKEANLTLQDIDCIAVTYAPGLIGALLVGIAFAKSIAYGLEKPLIPVHHLKGHIYSNFIENNVEMPIISLVVSGGHTNIVYIDQEHNFYNMGSTLDDAAGEAYDKVARVLGLGYPGGPIIDKMYYKGNEDFLKIKEASAHGEYNFSFSGIKTFIINNVNKFKMKDEEYKVEDIAASFQKAMVSVLVKKTIKAALEKKVKTILLAGGVAANSLLRKKLREEAREHNIVVVYPSIQLCTDNGAMIAAAAYYKYQKHKKTCFADFKLNGIAGLDIVKD